MDQSNTDKINRMHDNMYGPVGRPEESLMVQIITTVKEVKNLRIASDGMRGEVTDNTRTNKNLIKLMWLVVGLIVTTIGGILVNG
jgi:hypothetical protein